MINKKELFYVLLFLGVSILGLVVFGWLDLEFSQSVYEPVQWAVWVQRLAFMPAIIIAWLQSLLLTAYCFRPGREKVPVLPLVTGFLSSVGLPIYGYWNIMRHFGKHTNSNGWIMLICFLTVAIWAGMRIIRELPVKEEKIRIHRALTGLLIFYGLWGMAALLSFLWGRVPFEKMAGTGDYGAYTPWVLPGREQGGSMAPVTLALSFGIIISNYLMTGNNRGRRNALMALGLVYGLLVGWACLVNGSVYGSDVIIMAWLTYGIVFLGGYLFRKINPKEAGELIQIRHDGY